MALGVLFFVLGGLLAFGAMHWGALAWLLAWPAANFLIVAAGYVVVGARLLGKRPDGTIPLWSRVFFAPYFLVMRAAWHVLRAIEKEDCFNEVAPGVYVGRRCSMRELPPGLALVVDMTAEFVAPPELRGAPHYRCVPTLDGYVPDEKAFRTIVEEMVKCDGPIYVHCAAGHGRSATAAAAALLARGSAPDLDAVIALMQKARPRVRLGRHQLQMARTYCPVHLRTRDE